MDSESYQARPAARLPDLPAAHCLLKGVCYSVDFQGSGSSYNRTAEAPGFCAQCRQEEPDDDHHHYRL